MYAVATFLVVAVITTVFVQVLAGALIATGLPPEIAGFQARSAFSGAGFTTTETENVVNHPARRRIIGIAMLVGSLGTPTLVVSVLVGFLAPGPGSTAERTLVVVSGIVLVVLLIAVRPVRRNLEELGRRYARRRLLPALAPDAQVLATLGDGHVVASIRLVAEPGDTYRSLRGLGDALPGLTVLGVRRGPEFLGRPPVDVTLHRDDELVVYGHLDDLPPAGVH
jgi:hypothetical protein